MKKHILNFLVLTFLFPFSLSGETISLDAFIKETLKNHPFGSVTIQEYWVAKHNAKRLKAGEDWNLFLAYSHSKGQESMFSPTFAEETAITAFSGGVQKKWAQTGTQFTLSSRYNSTTDQPPFENFPLRDYHRYSVDVEIKQPLMKNAWGAMDKYPLLLSDYQQELAALVYKEDLEDFIVQLTMDYLDWQFARDAFRILEKQYTKSLAQERVVEKQYKRGAAERLDLTQAKQNSTSVHLRLLTQKREVTRLDSRIGSLYYGKVQLNPPALKPQTGLPFSIPMKGDALTYIQNNSNLAKLLTLQTKMESISLDYANSAVAPDLNLTGALSAPSVGTTASEAGETLGKNITYTVGVDYAFPIPNTNASEGQKSAEAAVIRSQENKSLQLLTVSQSLQAAFDELDTLRQLEKESIILASLASESAKLESKKYNQGRQSSVFFVLAAENQSLSSQLELARIRHLTQKIIASIQGALDQYQSSYIGELDD